MYINYKGNLYQVAFAILLVACNPNLQLDNYNHKDLYNLQNQHPM